MTTWKPARIAWLVLGAALVAAMAAPPADAGEYRRRCDARYVVTLPGTEPLRLDFRMLVTMDVAYTSRNMHQIRRLAFQKIEACVTEHARSSDLPSACQDWSGTYARGGPLIYDMQDYPLGRTSFSADIVRAFCDAHPSASGTLNVYAEVWGDYGCFGNEYSPGAHGIVEGATERIDLANNRIPFGCAGAGSSEPAQSFGEGSQFEAVEPPAQSFGEGSRFEAVEPPREEGGSEPAPPPVPPPAADFRLMPNIRLPGSDMGVIDVADGDWQACQAACAANVGCAAYTYRDRFQGVASVCLLKNAAGMQIPDTCCRSGIKQ